MNENIEMILLKKIGVISLFLTCFLVFIEFFINQEILILPFILGIFSSLFCFIVYLNIRKLKNI